MATPLDRPYKSPGRAPKLTREQADRMIYLYSTGTSTIDLAVQYGIHRWTVYYYIRGEHKHPSLRVAT